ncbi:hypothetical protein BST61_g5984 [Cercospora zeina]
MHLEIKAIVAAHRPATNDGLQTFAQRRSTPQQDESKSAEKYQARLASGRFHKRNNTLCRKAHELAVRSKVHVYLVVQSRGQFYVYTSHEHQGWPPCQDQIAQSYPLPRKKTAESMCATKDCRGFAIANRKPVESLPTAMVLPNYDGITFADYTRLSLNTGTVLFGQFRSSKDRSGAKARNSASVKEA